jgi:sorting nexin-8
MGLMGNLTSGEILEQLYHASKIEKIRGVVFMGMGEPLDNYENVLRAINGMTDTSRYDCIVLIGRFCLSPSRISISTVGVVPRILSLIKDAPEVGLALSLHAPSQKLREEIVPTAKAWSLDKIMSATDQFIENQNKNKSTKNSLRHILVEYVLISGANDTEQVAHELGELLQGREVFLNLIPYNKTDVPFDYKSPTSEDKKKFVEILRNEYGLHVMLRQTMGDDIDSACGQLVISQKGCDKVADIEDLGKSVKASSGQKIKMRAKKSESKRYDPVVLVVLLVLVVVLLYRHLY